MVLTIPIAVNAYPYILGRHLSLINPFILFRPFRYFIAPLAGWLGFSPPLHSPFPPRQRVCFGNRNWSLLGLYTGTLFMIVLSRLQLEVIVNAHSDPSRRNIFEYNPT